MTASYHQQPIGVQQVAANVPLVENGQRSDTYSYAGNAGNPTPGAGASAGSGLGFTRKVNSKFAKYRTENVGWRLAKRKELFARKRRTAWFSLGFAMAGIVLMMFQVELTVRHVYGTASAGSVLMKLCVTFTTVILLLCIGWYHVTEVKLFMVDNSLDDWRLALSQSRLIKLIVELVVCAIHPIPGTVGINITSPDARSQSLGALNKISFDFSFIFKSMMVSIPERVLAVIMLTIFFIGSWSLRACEVYYDKINGDMSNSMWIVAITYLTIGYGDIVPESFCGRTVAVLVGLLGTGCTALLVALLSRKLELSRAEKYVHSFVLDIELEKAYKHAAANILREGWLIFKYKKRNRANKVRQHQRQLLQSIHKLRKIKAEQQRMEDGAISITEMSRTQELTYQQVEALREHQDDIQARLENLEKMFIQFDNKLNHLYASITGRR